MLEELIEVVRRKRPCVHNITNYVTVNDCANAILAAGGSPIMADDEVEVEEIAELADALVLNIGTLNARTAASMLRAGRRAAALGKPVILDPVGAGASRLRTETALTILREVRLSAVRGNVSEIKALFNGSGAARGVDADERDGGDLAATLSMAKAFSERLNAVVAVTGITDVVADGARAYLVRNGCAEMSRVTGTGCMLTALCGCFAAATPRRLEAVAAAVAAMGLAGECALSFIQGNGGGTGAFRVRLIDEISLMTKESFREGARIEEA